MIVHVKFLENFLQTPPTAPGNLTQCLQDLIHKSKFIKALRR